MATFTTRLGLRQPDPDPATGDFINVQTDLNDNLGVLDGAVGMHICTSGTRPSIPFFGQIIWQTDTGQAFVCTGVGPPATWVLITDPAVLANLSSDLTDFTSSVELFAPNSPFSLGDGSKLARYKKIGRLTFFTIRFVMGTTTIYGAGRWEIRGIPSDLDRALTNNLLPAYCYDVSPANLYPASALMNASGTVSIPRISSRNAAGVLGACEATFPFTWTNGDILFIQGWTQTVA